MANLTAAWARLHNWTSWPEARDLDLVRQPL